MTTLNAFMAKAFTREVLSVATETAIA